MRRIFGEGTSPRARPATIVAPTATLLLQRVEDLVEQLPKDLRARLPDLIPAASGLERAGAILREKIERLDRALAELAPSDAARPEFSLARARHAARLADCVTALESLRTDLLRLSVGLGQGDGFTIALENAKELGAAIDAELHGQQEVRQLLK